MPILGIGVSAHLFLHFLSRNDHAIYGQLRLLSFSLPLLDQADTLLPLVAANIFLHAPSLELTHILLVANQLVSSLRKVSASFVVGYQRCRKSVALPHDFDRLV